jgi:hypothetical protein
MLDQVYGHDAVARERDLRPERPAAIWLFYRTLNGAQAGDPFMSLIHTRQLWGASSFDDLTKLQHTPRNRRPVPRSGCRGTIARRCSGSCP